jgi:uncharacterized membrane protein YdbT with pleckstrin-like domain
VETHPDERVIFQGHPSWRSILGFYIKGVFLAVLAGAVTALVTRIAQDEVKVGTVAVVAVAVVAVVLLVGFVKRVSTTYSITSERLHIRRGIVARRVQETRIERVQNVNTNQSIVERILQVGTVDFDTAGTTDSDFAFRGVAQPEKVMRAVDEAQREHAAPAGAEGPAAGGGAGGQAGEGAEGPAAGERAEGPA